MTVIDFWYALCVRLRDRRLKSQPSLSPFDSCFSAGWPCAHREAIFVVNEMFSSRSSCLLLLMMMMTMMMMMVPTGITDWHTDGQTDRESEGRTDEHSR